MLLASLSALFAAGASAQVYNNNQLTLLLLASMHTNIAMAEKLIKRPDITKEHRIDVLELLGASMVHILRGMEERFADPMHPVLKKPVEPVDAYENRRESQTLQELVVEIESNKSHLMLESHIITERILGKYNPEIPRGVRYTAPYYENIKLSTCSGLHRHALKTAKSCNKSPVEDSCSIKELIKMYENFWSDEEKQA